LKNLYLALILLVFSIDLAAQDVSFTQFFAMPYQINPALTGTIDGKYRIGMIYKDQWRGGVDNPYTTTAIGGEVRFDVNPAEKRNPDRAGIGIFFMNDQVNTFSLNTSQIAISGAYHKSLGKDGNQFLGAGAQISIFQRNIGYDNLNFGDEFNELDGFDQTSAEILPPNNLGFVDISLGFTYLIKPRKSTSVLAGAALHHLTSPNASFFEGQENLNPAIDPNSLLLQRIVAHVSVDQKLSEFLHIQPRVLYQQQGYNKEVRIGTNLQYFTEGNLNAFHFGAWLSAVDNVDGFSMNYFSPLVGFQLKSFLIGFSYDINIRQTFGDTRGLDAFELTFRFNGDYYNDDGFCPEF